MLAKHALYTTFEQSLQLTPAMMVSLKVLALNGLQLQDYIQEEVLSNPLLEWDQSIHVSTYDISSESHLESIAKPATLQDTLYEQLRMSVVSAEVQRVVMFMIDSLDARGYLDSSDTEIQRHLHCDLTTLQTAKSLLQQMDPPGIGASNLFECLMLQLDRYPKNDTVRLAQKMVEGVLVSAEKVSSFLTNLKATCDPLQWSDAVTLLSRLDFRPGWHDDDKLAKVPPDVIVRHKDGECIVSLNGAYRANIILHDVAQGVAIGTDTATHQYIREKTFAAKALLRSIDSRNETLLKVATEIFRRQSEFCLYGASHLRPLSIHEVAQCLSLHDSTVSRAVSGKTVMTPKGLFDLRFFITGTVTVQSEVGVSMHEVSHRIKELIAEENVEHPLSDQDIVSALQHCGMEVSRRTVTKYRLQLKIPCAAKRKLASTVNPKISYRMD